MATFDSINHRTLHINGIKMHIAEKGNKGDPIILFIHGFPELWYSWRHQILALSDLGYHAVAPDMRGYGETEAPSDPKSYTYGHIVGDLVALINELGAHQVFVVGHDWGAMVAWWLCLFRPDRVKALVNLSVPFSPRNPDVKPVDMLHALYGDDYYICRFQDKGKEIMRNFENPVWRAPPPGLMKINTDACWKSRDKNSGGFVIRNDTGEWILGVAMKLKANSPAEAELITMREALLYAKELKIDNFQLETDAEAIHLMLTKVEKYLTHVLGAILQEVAELLKLSWNVEITHTKRHGNMVAHNMAKMGMSITEVRKVFPEPPISVFAALDNDSRTLQLLNGTPQA